jgi:hypothetical protein
MWADAQTVAAVWTLGAALAFAFLDHMSRPVAALVYGAFIALGLTGTAHFAHWVMH